MLQKLYIFVCSYSEGSEVLLIHDILFCLKEKGGVKMILIQDGPQQTAHEKPLRISGDPQKVEVSHQAFYLI